MVLGAAGKFIFTGGLVSTLVAAATGSAQIAALLGVLTLVGGVAFYAGVHGMATRSGVSFGRALWIVWWIPTWSFLSDLLDAF